MAAPHSHSSTLFTTREGAPMRFYIRPGPNKRQLAPLITHGGGVVSRIQEPGAFLLAGPTEGHLGPGYISTAYITDCVSSNRSLSPRPYRLMPPRGLKTRADQRRTSTSQLTAVHGAPGETEDHDERPAVNLTNNAEAAVQGHREHLTASAAITEEATGGGEDNMEKTSGKAEGHSRTCPASRRSISAEASSKSGEDLKPVEGTTSSKDGVRIDATNGDERDYKNSGGAAAAHSTSSGAQKKPPSLRKMDVEQTLNEDENYSTLVIPEPRSSTPAPGNPNTVKDLETDRAHVNVLMKDGESPVETQFRRPKRKVAGKTTFGIRENQYSPNLKQKRAEKQADLYEKPKDEAQMSVHERHCGQPVRESPIGRAQVSNLDSRGTEDQREESHRAESPAGQMGHTTETESGAQYTAKELDVQGAEGHQLQSGFPPQGHKRAAALRRGRTAFTKEEDMAILLYIRDNVSSSCTVSGNALWMDMEKKKVLGRTWQAMKSRYVKYITNKKHKYKLPPKNPSLPSKDSIAERVQGSPKSNRSLLICASTSAVTPQRCDTSLPSASADIPQNLYAIVPSTAAASPKKLDSMLPSASTDTPQKGDVMLPSASVDTPQKGDIMLPIASDTPQKGDVMLPSASADTPQKGDVMLPSASTDTPQKGDVMLSSASVDTPQKGDVMLPSASADDPQKWDTMLPSVSSDSAQKRDTMLRRAFADSPQKRGTMLTHASTDSPQKRGTMLTRASTDSPQKRGAMLTCASTDSPQKRGAMLTRASTDSPQKRGAMLTRASTDSPQKRGAMLTRASTDSPQKRDAVLPNASADAHQSSSIKQHGAFTSANTLVANTASKERTMSTPKKRSSDPTNDNEPAPQQKGDRMLPSPPSDNTLLPDREDSGDSEALHIFERANMEFEETDDNASPQQPPPVVSQTKDSNKSASHVDETPSTSQAPESEGLREAMSDMMMEFKMDVSCVTQALFFNNGELGSTRHFLRTGARPDGYPIWEPEDDLDLKKNNPKMQSHLIQKYGADNVARRAAFLAG